ncbi:MAG: enoyl-CoA hydratase/isomerase family protein [Bdellovibrionales bacterium]|nr:enoyl-CoA hydratase/isomerase family protein [Bdellovibrionales bacterium]
MLQVITLNSPKNKNALSTELLQSIQTQLIQAAQNPKVKAVWIESATTEYFSSGGDVKSLYHNITNGDLSACDAFFTTEYATDYFIHIFKKPIITWSSGITFGGGLGLIQGASHKIFAANTIAAMPEVLIGLFPDVGASYFLQKLPSAWKTAVTENARRLNAKESLHLGLCDYVIDRDKKHIFNKINNIQWQKSNTDNHKLIEDILSSFATPRQKIDYIEQDYESENRSYACPLSIEFVKKQLQHGIAKKYRHCFEMEWQNAYHFCRNSNFKEGVRALLVDKDKKPVWVAQDVESYFRPVEEKSFDQFKVVLDNLERI